MGKIEIAYFTSFKIMLLKEFQFIIFDSNREHNIVGCIFCPMFTPSNNKFCKIVFGKMATMVKIEERITTYKPPLLEKQIDYSLHILIFVPLCLVFKKKTKFQLVLHQYCGEIGD